MSEADAKNWRKRLNFMRTIGALRAATPDERRVAAALERAKPEALQAAAHNRDHSEAGRNAALGALSAYGEAPAPWRLRVPGYLAAADLVHGDAAFFGWGARLRALMLLIAVASAAAATTAFFIARPLAGPSLATGASALILWVLLSLFRLKPARIVVLSAGDARAFGGSFRGFMGTELAGFGHVWRLAGPERVERPEPKIASAADYRALGHALRHLIGLNWDSAMGDARGCRPVGATPAWHELTQSLMLDSADAVVIDLSGAKDAAVWPLEAAHGQSGCVFVALWGQGEAAHAVLKQAGLNADCHLYAPDGHMLRRANFRAAMVDAMKAKLGAAV